MLKLWATLQDLDDRLRGWALFELAEDFGDWQMGMTWLCAARVSDGLDLLRGWLNVGLGLIKLMDLA